MGLRVRNIQIGEGRPKICVPITEKNYDEIITACSSIADLQADMIEWRVDYFDQWSDTAAVCMTLKMIREKVPDMPVIFTYRTHLEGGEEDRQSSNKYINDSKYIELLMLAARSGYADIIDVEYRILDSEYGSKENSMIRDLESDQCKILISKHYFDRTPDDEVIDAIFSRMNASGADILKLAVMPVNRHDVMRLLAATDRVAMKYNKPIITISMGKLGLTSRIIGQVSGSSVTFASAGKASAPGQIPVSRLVDLLAMIDYNASDNPEGE